MHKILGFYHKNKLPVDDRISIALNHFMAYSFNSNIKTFKNDNLTLVTSSKDINEDLFKSKNYVIWYSGILFPQIYPQKCELSPEQQKIQYVLNDYEKKGDNAILDFNGKFNVFVHSLVKNEVKIYNDEFGFHPLFYFQDDSTIVFSNDYESILKFDNNQKYNIDTNAIIEYLLFGAPQNNKTFFNQIKMMPPGSLITINNKGLNIKRIFKPLKLSTSRKKIEYLASEYYNTFKEQLNLGLKWYPEIDITLTGGADTRMILGAMDFEERQNRNFVTFASTYVNNDENQDILISKLLVNHYNLKHQVQYNNLYAIEFLNEQYFKKLLHYRDILVSGYLGSESLRMKASFPNNISEIVRSLITNDEKIYNYYSDFLCPIPQEFDFKQKLNFALDYLKEFINESLFEGISLNNLKQEILKSFDFINIPYSEVYFLNQLIFRSFFSRHCEGARSSMLMPCYVTQNLFTPFTDTKLLKIIWKISPNMLSSEENSLTYYIFKNHLPELSKIPSNSHLGDHNNLILPKFSTGKHTINNITVDYSEFEIFYNSKNFMHFEDIFKFENINKHFIENNHPKNYIWKDLFIWLNYITNL
ncbi:MAG TPA: hypothetical protein PKN32_08755 [Bacteroidales bacterium]|nr:hypothetical protein [Bacteroidales bacterium]